jgi:hypothetical protein
MSNLDHDAVRGHVIEHVERNRQALADLSDAIFWFAEHGLQEHATCALMCSLLEEAAPRTGANEALMQRFRPLLEPHYRAKRPTFT